MLFGGIVFALALAGLASLFIAKHLEERRGHALFPQLRDRLDSRALIVKGAIRKGFDVAETLPPRLRALYLRSVALSALGAARAAEYFQSKAYGVADRFSHKHRFERRETSSEFLKQVGEHPMRPRSADVDAAVEREA